VNASQIIGIFASIVVLAGFSVAIVNGDKAAKVIGAGGKAFSDSLRVATKGGK
jgi:hypothetical protein